MCHVVYHDVVARYDYLTDLTGVDVVVGFGRQRSEGRKAVAGHTNGRGRDWRYWAEEHPSPPARFLGSAVSSLSDAVQGEAPAAVEFGVFCSDQHSYKYAFI